MNKLQGQCLNFRDIIDKFESSSKKSSLIQIFSHNSKRFDKSAIEKATNMASRKPISIFKFVFYGIIGEVDENISELNTKLINALIYN